jgi:hypothetical protein
VYDVFGERYLRKVKKSEKLGLGEDSQSDAFDVDLEGRVLIYSSGDELVF